MSLSVVIFSRDDAEHLARCLATLRDDPPESLIEVIVVDNASVDQSAQVLAGFTESLPLQIVTLSEDTSFSRGNNLGLAQAGGEYILFLNPDTVPTAEVIGRCRALLESEKNVGLVGPSLIHPGDVPQENGWQLPHPARLIREHLRASSRVVPESGNSYTEVGWLMGCFLLGRRALLLELEGFDEEFWFHGTDLELCARVAATGKMVVRVEDVSLLHVGHQHWDFRRRSASHRALVQYTRREHGSIAACGVASMAHLAEVFRS